MNNAIRGLLALIIKFFVLIRLPVSPKRISLALSCGYTVQYGKCSSKKTISSQARTKLFLFDVSTATAIRHVYFPLQHVDDSRSPFPV